MKRKIGSHIKYIVGVDEAGRGPLAGPLAVGAVAAPTGFNLKIFREARDSKKMTAIARQKCFEMIQAQTARNGMRGLRHTVSFISSQKIDQIGLTAATRLAINNCLKKLQLNPSQCLVLLDGGLRAPKKYLYQKTIIRGDDKEKIISLASIVAKVSRDQKLIHFAKLYPFYNFQKHKGYGTAEHLLLIKKFGITPIHRLSFLK